MPACGGRDVTAELLCELRNRKIDVCAYYSVVYNNWAFLEHPEWRIQPATAAANSAFASTRYGHCCPNHPGVPRLRPGPNHGTGRRLRL